MAGITQVFDVDGSNRCPVAAVAKIFIRIAQAVRAAPSPCRGAAVCGRTKFGPRMFPQTWVHRLGQCDDALAEFLLTPLGVLQLCPVDVPPTLFFLGCYIKASMAMQECEVGTATASCTINCHGQHPDYMPVKSGELTLSPSFAF
jgi:hypothetical protein